MFMMFVNDVIEHINTDIDGIFSFNELKFFLILYADDQVLFTTTPESQYLLIDVENYYNTFCLKINTSKTKVMIF
jgi:hypothetical protein